MKHYKVKIVETCSNESMTYWTNILNMQTWQAMKHDLVEQALKSGFEHELILTEIKDKKDSHFIGAYDERELTRIKYGASPFEKQLQKIFA